MSKKNDKNLTVIDQKDDQKVSLRKQVESLSSGKWNILQEMLQEIQATDIIENDDSVVKLTEQIQKLTEMVKSEFSEDEEIKKLLLEYLPSYNSIRNWTIMEGWEEAVMVKVKSSYRFSKGRRAAVFDAIYKKAIEKGDMKAAELFCKMSGDLDAAKKSKESDEMKAYKEFNQILHGKK